MRPRLVLCLAMLVGLTASARGDEKLRDVADRYGMSSEEIAVDPEWLERRKGGGALRPPEHSGDLDG